MKLAKCPKCGANASAVNISGNYDYNGGFVACEFYSCMRREEIYSPAAWNAMAEREQALKARIKELEGKE